MKNLGHNFFRALTPALEYLDFPSRRQLIEPPFYAFHPGSGQMPLPTENQSRLRELTIVNETLSKIFGRCRAKASTLDRIRLSADLLLIRIKGNLIIPQRNTYSVLRKSDLIFQSIRKIPRRRRYASTVTFFRDRLKNSEGLPITRLSEVACHRLRRRILDRSHISRRPF